MNSLLVITPPVGGTKSVQRALVFTASSLGGGVVTGLLAFLIGAPIRSNPSAVLMLTTLVLLASVATMGGIVAGRRVPTLTGGWLVPRQWAGFGGKSFAALFGFHLGLGWRTRVSSNLFWLLLVGTLLAPRLGVAVLPFAAFAATRAAPVLAIAFWRHLSAPVPVGDPQLELVRRFVATARSQQISHLLLVSAMAVMMLLARHAVSYYG